MPRGSRRCVYPLRPGHVVVGGVAKVAVDRGGVEVVAVADDWEEPAVEDDASVLGFNKQTSSTLLTLAMVCAATSSGTRLYSLRRWRELAQICTQLRLRRATTTKVPSGSVNAQQPPGTRFCRRSSTQLVCLVR